MLIALVSALVGGATFAVFTDNDSNTGNTFSTGTVDINAAPQTAVLTVSNIAPGDFGTADITITNDGSLDLKYNITEALTGDLVQGTNGLQVSYSIGGVAISDLTVWRNLASGASEVLTVAWSLPTAADDSYQGTSAALDLTFNAEQLRNNP